MRERLKLQNQKQPWVSLRYQEQIKLAEYMIDDLNLGMLENMKEFPKNLHMLPIVPCVNHKAGMQQLWIKTELAPQNSLQKTIYIGICWLFFYCVAAFIFFESEKNKKN